MSLRETINRNPKIVTPIAVAAIVIVLIFIFYYFHEPSQRGEAFFSDDNGATYYRDDSAKIPPYTNNKGNEAVRAVVFRCGDKKFVGYLERYTADRELEVKRPSDKTWVNFQKDRVKADLVTDSPKCPDGSVAEAELPYQLPVSEPKK